MEHKRIRKAFVMEVFSGHEVEYEKRHNPIWKELEDVLKLHGAHNYSIFLHPQTRHFLRNIKLIIGNYLGMWR